MWMCCERFDLAELQARSESGVHTTKHSLCMVVYVLNRSVQRAALSSPECTKEAQEYELGRHRLVRVWSGSLRSQTCQDRMLREGSCCRAI